MVKPQAAQRKEGKVIKPYHCDQPIFEQVTKYIDTAVITTVEAMSHAQIKGQDKMWRLE